MKTLGQEWIERVTPTWDETDPNGRHLYMQAQSQLEQQAEELFTEWQNTTVPMCLREAMEDGEQFVGFQTEAWLLGTQAFERFRHWLHSQDLICNCGYPPDNDPDRAKGENIILMILPRTAEGLAEAA